MTKITLQNEAALALDNCDKEPIHIPGRIQPFGCLLAGPLNLSSIDYASVNTNDVVGVKVQTLLGKSFEEILDENVLHDIRNLLSLSTSLRQRERVGTIKKNGQSLEVFVYANPNKQAIIEFEPLVSAPESFQNPVDRMRLFLAKAGEQKTILGLLEVCAKGLQEITGYDRVKAYQYASNGDGEVVAETRNEGVESFLGLRYPAWDVPTQARALLVKNPLRMLSDIRQTPIPLQAKNSDLPDLDISLAHLRGVSPIHVEYLQNMGVGATMTLGLVVEGKLWGMFACHHMTPKIISSDIRIAVELFAQLVSLLIQQKIETEKSEGKLRTSRARKQILAESVKASDLLNSFEDIGPILQNVVECDGLAVSRNGQVETLGNVPSTDTILAISKLKPKEDNLIEATDTLLKSRWLDDENLIPENVAGCLLVRCTAAYPLQLLFFRDEKIRKLTWAGKPEKNVSKGKFGDRLTPRGSFSAYKEEQKGFAEDWTASDFEAGRELQILLRQITTKEERSQIEQHKLVVTYQQQQDLMIAELNHRVKNILALIRSLSRQAKTSSKSLESYADALEQRISALAMAHDLAASNTMQGVSLKTILRTELLPFIGEDNSQAIMSGPVIGLRPDVAPMVSLVFHEVVTNAAKYGALSTAEGIVRAKWSVDEDGLSFSWEELNGPVVAPPTRHGFGRSLIEKAIPYEFDGETKLDYAETGVKFRFQLPKDTLVELNNESDVKIVGKIGTVESAASSANVLLVEDNVVLSMDMVDSLIRLGAKEVETARTVKEALRKLDKTHPDFAILDLNLRGIVSFDIAEKLAQNGIPFFFVTGYGSVVNMPPEFSDRRILTKPIDDKSFSNAISAVYTAKENH